MPPTDLARLLNPAQLDAATWPQGPVCIVAGAGSGKTRVITHRLAFLVQSGLARPEELLAVTFTNKAARELRERVDALLPGVGGRLWVSTFHSAAARILREAHELVGLPRRFVIYDQDDSERLLRQIAEELNIPGDLLKVLGHRLEGLQHQGIRSEKFEPDPFDIPGKRLKEVYRVYEQRLNAAGAVDFGGLILEALRVLVLNPDASPSVARVKHAVVDEYQDVNAAQAAMVEVLAPRLKSLAVVGDDDQSIYRWRGASAYSLLRFAETFKNAHRVNLTENYRSTSRILRVANEVIKRNPDRLGKELWTNAGEGSPIMLRCLPGERDEAAFVVQDAQQYLARTGRARDVAVLYRTNAQSRAIEEALHRARIAYRIVGGLRFYERREVKDVIAYLRLVANPDSEIDLRRIINVPARAIGATTVQQLGVAAANAGVGICAALKLTDEEWTAAGIKGPGRAKLREFAALLDEIGTACAGQPPMLAMTEVVARTAYDQHLRREEDGEERIENLQSLARAATDYEEDARAAGEEATLESFLERVSLESETDARESPAESVSLMTLHSAKGLEFPCVYFVGLEEAMLPSSRALQSGDPEDLHEERRLCYVGMTRARQKLVLTFCRRRMTYGEIREGRPSRFLLELPENVLRDDIHGDIDWVLPRRSASRPSSIFTSQPAPASQPPPRRSVDRGSTTVIYDDEAPAPLRRSPMQAHSSPSDRVLDLDLDAGDVLGDDDAFVPGSHAMHGQYGRGRVLSVNGTGPLARVDVEFPSHGTRRIVARFLKRTS